MRVAVALSLSVLLCVWRCSPAGPEESALSMSLSEAISAVRRTARLEGMSAASRLEAVSSVRAAHAAGLEQFYQVGFDMLVLSFNSRSEWYVRHPITLHPKRNGVAAVSAIINDPLRIIMCTVPKIDSTTWRKVMLYLERPSLYRGTRHQGSREEKPPDQHNIKKNGVKLMAMQSPQEANRYYNDPGYMKFFHCRNPVMRALSAWLSKNAKSSNPIAFAADYSTFDAFVTHLKEDKVNLSRADAHIRHQHSYCDIDRGAHYDMLLKMESRRLWNDRLLHLLKLQNDSFVASLFLKQVRPKADRLEVFIKYYSPRTFQIVKELYATDIRLFGYEHDIALLEEIIKHRSAFLIQ